VKVVWTREDDIKFDYFQRRRRNVFSRPRWMQRKTDSVAAEIGFSAYYFDF